MKKLSRRDFLHIGTNSLLGLSPALGLGGIIRFLSYEMNPAPPSEYDLGPVTDYPPGSTTMLMHIPAVLVHDKDGEWLALSLKCTHLGCTVVREQADRLKDLGRWIRTHEEAVYSTIAGLGPEYFYGPTALSPDSQTVYLYLLDTPKEFVVLKGIKNSVRRIRTMSKRGGSSPGSPGTAPCGTTSLRFL